MQRWLLAVAFVGAGAAHADSTKDELEKMQGTWTLASVEGNGQKSTDDQVKGITRTIKGDRYEVTKDGKSLAKGTMTFDPTKTPKTLDAVVTSPAEGGGTKTVKVLGIYELDGDTMKTCLAEPGKDRPTDFSTKEGSGRRLFVWKREKK
jgi:uncharacterized protein (TIGR03067 family)